MTHKKVNLTIALRVAISIATVGAMAIPIVGSPPGSLEITRVTIDGGGVINSSGGDYELSGTIGQHDAGVMSGGDYRLSGGFWFGLSRADCNEDGLVSAADHQIFAACMMGPDGGIDASPCPCFDTDSDGDVTLNDFADLQIVFSGQ